MGEITNKIALKGVKHVLGLADDLIDTFVKPKSEDIAEILKSVTSGVAEITDRKMNGRVLKATFINTSETKSLEVKPIEQEQTAL